MGNLVIQGQDWQAMKEQASIAIKSNLMPKSIDTPEKALIIMMMGREIGIPPMQALNGIDVIQNKPALKPREMLAQIYRHCPGAVINFLKTTDDECIIEAKRPGGKFSTFNFTIEDARRLGLLSKDNWQKQPGTMLIWRCVGKMARVVFPDAIAGIPYTPEELGADVDEEGEVIEVKPEKKREEQQQTPPPQKQELTFDKMNPDHVAWLKKGLHDKLKITDDGDIDCIIAEMQDQPLNAETVKECVNKMLDYAKTVEAKPNPMQSEVDRVLDKIDGLGAKK